MKTLAVIIVFLLGAVTLPLIIGLISYSKTPYMVENHRLPGKVLGTTTKYNFYKCNKKGMTLVQLDRTKKILVLCGIHKFPGEKISITVDGPMQFDI